MRVLGIDLGKRRIGVAVGESEVGVATPRPALTATGTLARDTDAVVRLAAAEGASVVVVGVPSSHDSPMSRACARLAELLRERGLDARTVDETLTSVEAGDRLAQTGLKAAARRARIDSEAACLILERFFAEAKP